MLPARARADSGSISWNRTKGEERDDVIMARCPGFHVLFLIFTSSANGRCRMKNRGVPPLGMVVGKCMYTYDEAKPHRQPPVQGRVADIAPATALKLRET